MQIWLDFWNNIFLFTSLLSKAESSTGSVFKNNPFGRVRLTINPTR